MKYQFISIRKVTNYTWFDLSRPIPELNGFRVLNHVMIGGMYDTLEWTYEIGTVFVERNQAGLAKPSKIILMVYYITMI